MTEHGGASIPLAFTMTSPCRWPRYLPGLASWGYASWHQRWPSALGGYAVDRLLGHDGGFPQLVFDRISLVINGLQRARNTIRGLFILMGYLVSLQ